MHSSRMRTVHSLPYGGLCPGRLPNRDPPGQRLVQTETPQTEIISRTGTPCTETPPGQRHPLDRDPQDRDPPGQRSPLDKDLPSVNRITDMCKNINLPQLRCGW